MARTISFTTNVGCRIQCKFCPQDDIMTSYAKTENISKIEFGSPPLMTYQKFVSMLEKIPKDVVIIFSGLFIPALRYFPGRSVVGVVD